MKLKRLIVQGFKSFKDKAVIHFDKGVTGIVGPNGCGKSNIVDALFWVMGEQSAKHLRGNSMKDVIFAGSSKYTPASWAEVSLILENPDGKYIHIGSNVVSPQEIQLTRKLYRNGDSEYRINGVPCRLRDIQEVFMDTGAGAKSYSVVAQGEINRIIQSKPQERRSMIEEVAGITKFKVRRKESVRKMEQTQENLNRITDLKVEVHKNLKILEEQAEKAKKARRLREKIKHSELVTASHKEMDYLQNYQKKNQRYEECKTEVEELIQEKEKIEIGLEVERLKRGQLIERVEVKQKDYHQLAKEQAGNEQKEIFLTKTIKEKTQQLEKGKKNLTDLHTEGEETKAKVNELEERYENFQKDAKDEESFDELSEAIEHLKEKMELKESILQELNEEIYSDKESFHEINQQKISTQAKIDDCSKQIDNSAQECEKAEDLLGRLEQEGQIEEEKITHQKNNLESLGEKKSFLLEEQKDLVEKKSKLKIELEQQTKEYLQTDSRLTSLKEIKESGEDLSTGVKEFLKKYSNGKYKILGDLIECSEEYTKPVERFFSDILTNLIPLNQNQNNPDINDIKSLGIIDIIKASSNVKIDQLTSSSVKENLAGQIGGKIIAVEEIINISNSELSELKTLFNNCYIVENIPFQLDWNSLPSNIGLITYDCESLVRSINGAKRYTIGLSKNNKGVLERNNLIKELEIKIQEQKILLDSKKAIFAEIENKEIVQRAELEDINDRIQKLREGHIESSSKYKNLTERRDGLNEQLRDWKRKSQVLSTDRLNLLEQLEHFESQIEDFQEIHDGKKQDLEDLQEEITELKSQYEDKREVYLKMQVEREKLDQQEKVLCDMLADYQARLGKVEKAFTDCQEEMSKYKEEKNLAEEQKEELTAVITSNVETLLIFEKEIAQEKEELNQLSKLMEDREKKVKKLNEKLNKNDKELTLIETQIEQIKNDEFICIRDQWEKYQVDMRSSVIEYLELSKDDFAQLEELSFLLENSEDELDIPKLEEFQFVRKYGQELKDIQGKVKNLKNQLRALGEINWTSIENFDRQKERYDYLVRDEEELKNSLTDLEAAIAHIDVKSKEKFKYAFDQVNEAFKKIFPRLFGGGTGHLLLNGEWDDPECGMDIVARPPGKKMQNINLMSGGEKAMTAVSLIFAIFMVRPSPFCLLDEVDAPLDDANVGRFNDWLKNMSSQSQFILITHNKKTMELNDTLYGITMQEPGISKAVNVQLQ